jgi:hypothetical protein
MRINFFTRLYNHENPFPFITGTPFVRKWVDKELSIPL